MKINGKTYKIANHVAAQEVAAKFPALRSIQKVLEYFILEGERGATYMLTINTDGSNRLDNKRMVTIATNCAIEA